MHLKSSQIFKMDAFSLCKTLNIVMFSGFSAILINVSRIIRTVAMMLYFIVICSLLKVCILLSTND